MRLMFSRASEYAAPAEARGAEACVTCGEMVATRFCPGCGEMRASDRDHSVVAFMREHVLESVLSLDGRVLRTVKALLLTPGELTAAFMRGKRAPYLPPLQCFLLLNVLFFLASPGVLDFPLRQQLNGTPWMHDAQRMVLEKIAQEKVDYTVFAAKYNAMTSTQARSLVILMVPMFAVVIGVLAFNRNRPVVQHLVYSLHTYSFFFVGLPLAIFAVGTPLYHVLHATIGLDNADPVFTSVAMLALTVYLTLSSRRAYEISKCHALLIGVLGTAGVTQIMVMYRHLMLYVTLRSM
jgi:hypothetical protein